METSILVKMNVSTFNVRGLTDKFKQNCLLEDNASFKLDFCLLHIYRSSIDSFQRKHIRRPKKVHWPNVIKNEECDSVISPLHQEVRLRRLKMLGHIYRNDLPAKKILKKPLKNFKRKRG